MMSVHTVCMYVQGVLPTEIKYNNNQQEYGADMTQIDDPEHMCKGQPLVPKTVCLLHQKVECMSTSLQGLHDLASTLE